MNKKDFGLGLLTGFFLALLVAFFLLNYYVDQKIEATKTEAQQHYESVKEDLETKYQQEIATLKQYIKNKAAEKSKTLMDKATGKVKEYWNKEEVVQDTVVNDAVS